LHFLFVFLNGGIVETWTLNSLNILDENALTQTHKSVFLMTTD